MAQSQFWNDERVENIIGNLLRAGVILAAAVVLAGGVLYVVKYSGQQPQYGAFRGEPSDLRNVSQIVDDAILLHSRGLIQLGLLLLIATPVARVAFSVIAFAAERDWLYVVVTLIVLGVLLYSLTST
ncbi:MAG: DUF1634 domain-containing protein [Candidatus Acidiferrales bacterium]